MLNHEDLNLHQYQIFFYLRYNHLYD